jgi:hypothetical protein
MMSSRSAFKTVADVTTGYSQIAVSQARVSP